MKIQKLLTHTSLAIILGTSLIACSSTPSSTGYDKRQAGVLQNVQYGTVNSVRNVLIQNENTGVGNASGAVLGGLAGSHVGGGSGKVAGAVVGAVLGGIAGSTIDKNIQTKQGIEITVRLSNGKVIAVTQLPDEHFNIGDRVKVISANGKARITH